MKALLVKRQEMMVSNRVHTDMIVDWVMIELKGSNRKGLVFPGSLLKDGHLWIFDGDNPHNTDSTEYYDRISAETNKKPNSILKLKSRLMLLSDIISLPKDTDNSDVRASTLDCYWFTSESVFEPASTQDIVNELKSFHILHGDILIARYKTHRESECGMYWHFKPHETLDHWTPVLCEGEWHGQPVYKIR